MGPWGVPLYPPPPLPPHYLNKVPVNNNKGGSLAEGKPENGDVPKSAEDRADEPFVEVTTGVWGGVSNLRVPVHRRQTGKRRMNIEITAHRRSRLPGDQQITAGHEKAMGTG